MKKGNLKKGICRGKGRYGQLLFFLDQIRQKMHLRRVVSGNPAAMQM
ncbi:hypothetical protein [Clostridium sp. Marseille-P2415]|nr:hypothetical protein [Clostridium sp. Marseille-P2415]